MSMNTRMAQIFRKYGVSKLNDASKTIQKSYELYKVFGEMKIVSRSYSPGLNFAISNDSQELIDVAERFAREEMIPKAKYHDETGEYPWDIVKKAHSLGLMNPHIPQEYGGLDLKSVDAVQMVEKLAYGCCGIVQAIDANNLASMPIILAGNHEQRKKYLSWLIEEPVICSYCVTEPGAGSDVSGIKTTAVKKGRSISIDSYLVDFNYKYY